MSFTIFIKDQNMKFEEKINGNVVLLPLEGKLMGGNETNALSDELSTLISKGHKNIILDFEKVKWINSPGIGMIMKWLLNLRENGGDLRFTNTEGCVQYYLDITNLASVIKTYPTPNDAINSFHPN